MLMSRQGVSDGRSYVHDSSGECRVTHRISFVECRSEGVLSSTGAECKTAFRDLAMGADKYREVVI
jgi:hypothetical protein